MKLISDNALEKMLATVDAHHAANVQLEKMAATIDTNPTVHAHWIQAEDACGSGYNFYECSACKEIQFLNFGTPQWNEWNYCPYCGAKMDEKTDD